MKAFMKNFAFKDRLFSVSITALCFIELIRRYYCEVTLENEIENRRAVSLLGKSGGHLPLGGGLWFTHVFAYCKVFFVLMLCHITSHARCEETGATTLIGCICNIVRFLDLI